MTPEEKTRLENIVKRMDYILEKNEKRSDGWAFRKQLTELRDEIANSLRQDAMTK